MWHTVGRERGERLVRRRGSTCARSRRGLSVVKIKQIHNWCRHGLRCLACDFGLHRRRTALAGRIRGVHAAGRGLVIASIVLFKVGSSRWCIPEPTAAPTARVFFYSGISDDLKKKRARSHLDRTRLRWFHNHRHHYNCPLNHSRTLHSARHYRQRTHRYRCRYIWIGWP